MSRRVLMARMTLAIAATVAAIAPAVADAQSPAAPVSAPAAGPVPTTPPTTAELAALAARPEASLMPRDTRIANRTGSPPVTAPPAPVGARIAAGAPGSPGG